MKKIISVVLIHCFMMYIIGCSRSQFVDLETPPAGESVKINLVDGTSKKGVILKRSADTLKYIDVASSKPEDLNMSRIKTIEYVSTVYDLTGKKIPENEIGSAEGSGKMWAYGAGGFLAGGLIGFGGGALYSGISDQSVALIYPIIGFGIAGAVFLGMKGSELDRQEAIDDIRKKRYEITQKKLDEQLKQKEKELEKQKKDLNKIKGKKKPGK